MAGRKVTFHYVTTRQEVERCANIGWSGNEEACLTRVKQSTSEDRCVAWVHNSIDDVVRIYRQPLSQGMIPTEKISLFHSRFAFYDRQRIEKETLSHFGKDDSTQRVGRVLTAIQVIEQSLDIDMDGVISDLVPIDLLIQRAGRLQRRIRDRHGRLSAGGEDGCVSSQLVIFAPEWDEVP